MNISSLSPVKYLILSFSVVLVSLTIWSETRPLPATDVIHSSPVASVASEVFSTVPPDASKISISAPNSGGVATATGADGAVPAQATVLLVNLSSTNVVTTTANGSGAFSAQLFSPPGSSLLVKYDVGGDILAQYWQAVQLPIVPDFSYINPLPGTIIPVGDLPDGSSTVKPYQAAGFSGDWPNWVGWWLTGTVNGPPATTNLRVQPGDTLTINGLAHFTSPTLSCTNPAAYNPVAHIHLRYLFDEQGHSHPWGIWFNAHLFTPTGLPIEHEASGEIVGIGSAVLSNRTCVSSQTLTGEINIAVDVPADFPPGTYQLEAHIDHGGVPEATGLLLSQIWYHNGYAAKLPVIGVGSPAPPRIPWTLFGDYPINGHRGVTALEDAGEYAMPTRVLIPPETAVIPRINTRTNQPIVYRLEPGSHWLSGTDRRLPPPPHIPLAFPAGTLTAVIHTPDGTTQTIGPAPIQQSAIRTPTTPGGSPIDHGTGHIGDLYHLYTADDRFALSFDQYGPHTIELSGNVKDIQGNTYPIAATYEFIVAQVLDLDPAQLPTTPYEQGDAFAPGLHLFPPVPADVSITLQHLPNSDPAQAITHTITGQANDYGYFQPPSGTEIRLNLPGEFRVDITAVYESPDGTFWAGSMTWGGVVESPTGQIEAHGRRGMDYHHDTIADMPTWFRVFDLPSEKVGIENYYPYFSGDIHWGNEDTAPGDSIHSIITIKDKAGINGPVYNQIRANYPRSRGGFRWPPDDTSLTGLEKRLAVGEAPLFFSTNTGGDAAVFPQDIDQFAYWYGSSERADVRVREIISEDNMGTAYWRFNDTYGYQIGEGADGDLPGDLKWEFGGAVFRVPNQSINEYAIYSSLWVLLPHGCDAYGCARVTPPFQDATGASINGGPILTLRGEEIDMFFLPKGVRPGDILQMGETIAFSGHVGPPLDSRVAVTITSPTGATYSRTGHANKIGWLYDPTFDFVANEAGRWTVDVRVEHDRPYVGNGVTPSSHNIGTVLGTSGRYSFYVVDPGLPNLTMIAPEPGFLTWPGGNLVPVTIQGIAPAGTTAVHYTIHDKGIVMGQGTLVPDDGSRFKLIYDPVALNMDFPMLSLTAHEGQWPGLADEVAIHFLAEGSNPQAASVTLIGEEIFIETTPWHRLYLPTIIR